VNDDDMDLDEWLPVAAPAAGNSDFVNLVRGVLVNVRIEFSEAMVPADLATVDRGIFVVMKL